MELSGVRVGVIGASLGGLSVANTLSRAGAEVMLLERGAETFSSRGGGLGVDLELAAAVVGGGAPPSVALRHRCEWRDGASARRRPCALSVTSYGALWRWLRAPLRSCALEFQRDVRFVELGPRPRVTTADARSRAFDLLVAADGGASAIRRQQMSAAREYAGYVLWRGLVPLAALERRASIERALHVCARAREHFVAYPIPSHDGELAPREQLINWGWYRRMSPRSASELVRAEGRTPHLLDRDAAALELFSRLWRDQPWPPWTRELVRVTRARGRLGPHPVYHCLSPSLARGRLALVGDAGHLASPITGSGARLAMEDALELAAALTRADSIEDGLEDYSRSRLARAGAVVRYGITRGRAFA